MCTLLLERIQEVSLSHQKQSNSFFNLIQCDQIWRNFTTLANLKKVFGTFLMVYLIGGWQNWEPTLAI